MKLAKKCSLLSLVCFINAKFSCFISLTFIIAVETGYATKHCSLVGLLPLTKLDLR